MPSTTRCGAPGSSAARSWSTRGCGSTTPGPAAACTASFSRAWRPTPRGPQKLGLHYWPFVETAKGQGRGLLGRLAERACLVVTDEFPCYIVPGQSRPSPGRWRSRSSPSTRTPWSRCPCWGHRSTLRPTFARASTRPSPRRGRTAPRRSRGSRTPPGCRSRPRSRPGRWRTWRPSWTRCPSTRAFLR